MDVIKYLNSRDIAEHLKSIDFEFNAMQAAYIVYINQWLTIAERLKLWREIVDTMSDCDFQFIKNQSICVKPSAHAAILEHIQKIENDLASFMESEAGGNQSIYVPLSATWARNPEWLKPKSEERLVVGGGVFETKPFEQCHSIHSKTA